MSRSESRRRWTYRTTGGRVERSVLLLAALAISLGVLLAPSAASAQEPTDDDRILADQYAPVYLVKQQDHPCDTNGEPFEPAPVEIVLDNPEVFLRQVGNDDPVAMRGPGAADLLDLREGWYLDFPGDGLAPECVFEEDFARFMEGRRSTVYAHVATEAARPGFLALQYWTFWYHNPGKNDHEGDWEFVQILFEADSATEALDEEPVAIAYAQHRNGERRSWDDAGIERDGVRPVVYAARGSHASYFGSAVYLGRDSDGFGCDSTDGPSRRLDPEVVLLPSEVTDPDDPLAWVAFQGRWGQREPAFFNGPTGPFAKGQWTEPVTWHEGLRTSSLVVPAGDGLGQGVLTSFCTVVEVGSTALAATVNSPATILVVLAALVVIVVLTVRLTTWRPVTTRPIEADRSFGQILRAAGRIARRHPFTLLGVGLVYVPVGLATSMIEAGIFAIPFFEDLISLAGERSGVGFVLAMLVGGVADLLAFVYVSGVVARLIGSPGAGRQPPWAILRRDDLRALFAATWRGAIVVIGLLLSVIGIPWAIRQLVRYQVAAQVVVLEGASGPEALRRSSRLVQGRWWWTAGAAVTIEATVLVAGFVAAVIVLVALPSLPLWAFALVSAVIHVALVPIGGAAMTYVYGTLVAKPVPGEAPESGEVSPRDEVRA